MKGKKKRKRTKDNFQEKPKKVEENWKRMKTKK